MYKPRFFKPQELVPRNVYDLFLDKDMIYRIFDENALKLLDWVRDICTPYLQGRGMVCNNWKRGGTFQNRGFRPATSTVGAKRGSHRFAKGFDVSSPVMTTQQMFDVIEEKKDTAPCKFRIQRTKNGVTPTYLHIDTMTAPTQAEQIFYFNA